MISNFRREGVKLSSLWSQRGLAVIAFIMILAVFALNSGRICQGYEQKLSSGDSGIREIEGMENQEVGVEEGGR
jgi:hypothetical protein